MNNKAQSFNAQQFVIAGLLFTAVIVFFSIGLADLQNNYPNNPNIVNEDFADNYNELTELTNDINTMRNTSLSGEGLSFRGTFDVTFGSFFTVMQLLFGTLNLFGDMYTSVTTDFPFVDAFVFNQFMIIIFSIITVVLIFLLINAVGRNRV